MATERHGHLPAWVVAMDGRWPWLLDGAIAALIIALSLGPNHQAGSGEAAFSIALAVPLLWRRRYPRIVFGVVAAVAFGQWIADVPAVGDLALLVALFSVAAATPLRDALMAAAVLEVGVVMATTRWAAVEPFKVFVGLSGLSVAAGVLGVTVRSRRELVSSLHERAARLEFERDQQGRLSAAAERARIARELHDIVAHHLSVMISLADGATYQLDESPERAREALETASRTGRQALSEMRRLLGVLRDGEQPAFAPQPGLEAIDALVERMRAAGVPVHHERAGDVGGLEPGLQLTAHRIVQESLTNILKHAGDGAEVWVTVSRTPAGLVLEVRDGGVGGVVDPSSPGGGLRGMRERAAVYGGVVDAGPHPDGGWAVSARLPVEAAQPSLSA